MQHDHPHYHKPDRSQPWWKTPLGIGAVFFFALAAYALIREHADHIGGAWIWLIFLACPLMHVFMHGRHHHRHGGQDERED